MRSGCVDRLCFLLILSAVAFAAGDLFTTYHADPAPLWRDVQHDRNSHLAYGFEMALRMRALDPLGWLSTVAKAVVWPPLHGIVLSGVLLGGGLSHRVAIFPSLLGWSATAVLCALIAWRLAGPAPVLSRVAGGVALTFALASPGWRLLGSDVMLEGLGAGLSAAVLLAWLLCADEPTRVGRWRVLGLLMTLLFLCKYNYFALIAASLVAAAAPRYGASWWAVVRSGSALVPGRMWADPLLLGSAALGLLVLVAAARWPLELTLFGRPYALHPPQLFLGLPYGLLLLRLSLWWRAARAELAPLLGTPGLTLLRWHVFPAGLWLLAPSVLGGLFWFLGANYRTATGYDAWRNLLFQADGFANGFHVAPWATVLVLALATLGTWASVRRGAPGFGAVITFALLSAAAVVLHPQQQWRFQATSLFALWSLAGVGAASLLGSLARGRTRAWLGGAVVIALSAQLVSPKPILADAVAIRRDDGPSDLSLADAYATFVAADQPIGFVSTLGKNDFVVWTRRERCRCLAEIDQPFTFANHSRAEVKTSTEAWLSQTPVRRVVAIEAPLRNADPFLGLTSEQQGGQLEALAASERFHRLATASVPDYPAVIAVWDVASGKAPPTPRRFHIVGLLSAMLALASLAVSLWPRPAD